MPGSKASKLKNRALAHAFLAELNAQTICAHCGSQPIEWHNPEHVQMNRRAFQIGFMASSGRTIDAIKRELTRCTPLCRRCHMREDGRLQSFVEQAPHQEQPARSCIDCGRPYKPLRRGRCSRCDQRQRYYQQTPDGRNRGAVERRRWPQRRGGSICCELAPFDSTAAQSRSGQATRMARLAQIVEAA